MTPATTSHLEHVAVRVYGIHWHIRFFHKGLGQTMRELEGTAQHPWHYWTLGGLQFMAAPGCAVAPSNDTG